MRITRAITRERPFRIARADLRWPSTSPRRSPAWQASRRKTKRPELTRVSCPSKGGQRHRSRPISALLLAVAGQNLLARLAYLRPVGLQAAQNAKNVLRINLKLGLAVPGDVGMAGVTLLRISLPHSAVDRRRLGRQLLSVSDGTRAKRQSDREDRYTEHDPPFGHPARPVLRFLSHTFLPFGAH
jgi:hypothetical protein